MKNTKVDGGLYDTDMVQTVSHVLPTGGPGFNYTHQQLKLLIIIQVHYQKSTARGNKGSLFSHLLWKEQMLTGHNNLFCSLIKQLTFSEK